MKVTYLIITVLGFSSLALFMKLGSRKGVSPFNLSTSVYVGGFLLSLLTMTLGRMTKFVPDVILWGIIGGMSGGITFLLFVYAVKIGHYGFSCTILYTSFLIPMSFSVLFLKNELSFHIVAGTIFILFSLFLILAFSDGKGKKMKKKQQSKWLFYILSAFLLNGITLISQIMISQLSLRHYFSYLFISYATGSIILLIILVLKKRVFNKTGVFFGIGGALGSFVGIFFTLRALGILSGTIVFPITLSGPMIAAAILSRFLFKEKISIHGYAGIILGIIGICILGMGR